MMSTSSSVLPTTPIGKQQVIDLKAGAILRENARKSGLFFGCPLAVVLVLIILAKCLFLSFWIIREYETFDFRCSAWTSSQLEMSYRAKRWTLFENSDPRKFSKNPDDEDEEDDSIRTVIQEVTHKKPLYGRSTASEPTMESPKIDARLDFGPLPPNFQRRIDSNHIPEVASENEEDLPMTTMVTLTNTQIVPLSGEEHGVVKMKTIRNRVEKVGSDEEQFIEIDIANAPRIYVSKIKSRGGEQPEEHFDLFKDLKERKVDQQQENKPKKKGKGLKKAKKLRLLEEARNATTTVLPESTSTLPSKKKGKKGKKGKKHEEVTKNPRHLVGKASSLATTPSPHGSSWINGVLDPRDPKFSNQGEIRGYPMQKASRRPQANMETTTSNSQMFTSSTPGWTSEEEEKLKISESTRMMWDMDELKYTTFLAPKTTEQSKFDPVENAGNERNSNSEASTEEPTTTEKPLPGGMSKTEWEQKKEEFEKYTPTISKADLQPATSSSSSESDPHLFLIPSSTTWPSPFNVATTPSEAPYYVEVNDADTETIYVKEVTPMYRGILMQPETTTKPYDPLHLEMEIAKLKESSTCLARMAFDIWCLFVLFSSVPFLMGVCVPRWSLFVLHIVFDFLFLVVGFVSSLTIAIMSSIMYFLIDEMTSDSLFEFLLVAFVIDIVLILYSIVVGIAYRCCCRLVDNSIKDQSINYSVSTNGEPV